MSSTLRVTSGDIIVSSSTGRPILVSGQNKLRQDIKEFFEISVTATGFGSGLSDLIGLVQLDQDAFVSSAYGAIVQGLQAFRALQRADFTTPRTNEELLSSFDGIKVVQDPTDPTKFIFTANIYSVAGSLVPYSGILGG